MHLRVVFSFICWCRILWRQILIVAIQVGRYRRWDSHLVGMHAALRGWHPFKVCRGTCLLFLALFGLFGLRADHHAEVRINPYHWVLRELVWLAESLRDETRRSSCGHHRWLLAFKTLLLTAWRVLLTARARYFWECWGEKVLWLGIDAAILMNRLSMLQLVLFVRDWLI